MSLCAVLAMIFGFKHIAQNGLGLVPAVSIAIGILIGAAFVRRQQTLSDPLIDLGLFRLPGFSASLATLGLGVIILFGGFLYLPQYLQLVVGLSPLDAGLWSLPWALAFVVGSMITPSIVRRIHPATVMAAGLALASVGFAMFTRVDAGTPLAVVVVGSVLFALGFAPVFTLTTDLVVGSAPPERAGAASAISETSAEFGGALGIAILGSIGVAVYRGAMAGAVPDGVPVPVAEAARDTLGAAVAMAGQLPGQLGAQLLSVAREAFIDALQLTAAISAVGSIALAIFVATVLRRVPVQHEAGEPHDLASDSIA
jgi:MFS transporter, DHA2 family, multidrug resistance protein